jgi:ribonuclease PH
MRSLSFVTRASKYAEGSCLISFGGTKVFCTASVEERVPLFLKNTGLGWVTAEYGMLPRSTDKRMDREAARGKQTGRTQEIQRLIGRSLRAVVDRELLGERQIRIDCDVLQADGGTRTAAITGAYVALHTACQNLLLEKTLKRFPLRAPVVAVSAGIYQGACVLDLDFAEDSAATVDGNFVFSGKGELIEIQTCGEERPFKEQEFQTLLSLAQKGAQDLLDAQKPYLT